MHREIKFRAWIKPGIMKYDVVPFQWDYCINRMVHKCIESNGEGMLGSEGTRAKFEVSGFSYNGSVEKCLMQFTGLKDKTGKDIYEGDIIEQDNNKEWREVVGYDKENAAFGFITDENKCTNWAHGWGESQGFTIEHMEVIGNIYENPDLLKNE